MITTLEMGPRINVAAPEFCLVNHENIETTLPEMVGTRGLLMGFTGDIWQPASVRRILWLQRHYNQFARMGVDLALLICDKPHMLYGFSMSSTTPLKFPLLADVDRNVHKLYRMDRYAGLVLLDNNYTIRDKWIVPDERVWPRVAELVNVFETL